MKGISCFTVAMAMAGLALAAVPATAAAANASDCPNDGVVRYGVEPFDTAPRLIPIYEKIAAQISEKLGCEVKVYVSTNYNAEIEAMRNGKLEIGEFGPSATFWPTKSPRPRPWRPLPMRRATWTPTGPAS